jgi:hypothetical protein
MRQLFLGGNVLWLSVPALIGLVALAWRFRCLHRGPLSLLPAVTDFTGEKLPARWYCDRCGRSWPAQFEHETKPIQKYIGYDEKKAAAAIERAQTLEDQKRSIAMQRAGLRQARIVRRKRVAGDAPESTHPNVVPIGDVRRQA